MSIPPLVCSTPPPPDQCEDDKDPEDFDIQYHLSQDEDEDNYDYGNFSTYNHFQTSKSKEDFPVVTNIIVDHKIKDSIYNNQASTETDLGTNITSECKSRFEEEINIEDLDLKLDQEVTEQSIADVENSEVIKPISQKIDLNECVEIDSELQISDVNSDTLQTDDFVVDNPNSDQVKEPPDYIVETIASVDDLQLTSEPDKVSDVEIIETKHEIAIDHDIPPATDQKDEDDDFDDFQFSSTAGKAEPSVNFDNPWDNNNSNDDGFGDFKANFDDNGSNLFSVPVENSMNDSKADEIENKDIADDDDDDDFGDFNDFKSTVAPSTSKGAVESEEGCDGNDELQLLNLDLLDEVQIKERVDKVICDSFLLEIPEPVKEFQGKLDNVLGVTWGHLLEIDERQPYMVNWNNSLGQKTLLKALCIDSRNILFGPKWNYNMPKYAANLTAAPLQPQKQAPAPSSSQIDTTSSEKSASKPPGTWTDPFTSDGQDSCNPDRDNPETGPTDLDVFEASTSTKPDKIFSSTINVQPIRQISLPDTHIFTPTDSETPRSTTIHYDSSPTVLLPQSVIETSKSEPNFKNVTEATSDPIDNDEYWEFQDFKGTSQPITPSADSMEKREPRKTNTNMNGGSQVLQPIKMEPVIPTLNWPDPGEVKETFDDFSDFISNSTLSTQIHISPVVPIQPLDSKPSTIEIDTAGPSISIVPNKQETSSIDNIDDEFDTFQSALPSTSSMDFGFTITNNTSTGAASKPTDTPLTEFDYAFPKINNFKSETISLENTNMQKDALVQNQVPHFPNNLEINKVLDSNVKSPPTQTTTIPMMPTNLLQPTPANSGSIIQNQKSAQILQPLSLESYSQINWPNPGIDLQDLSRFNPVETLHSLKTDLSANSQNKEASPVHSQKSGASSQAADDDIWGDFVSSKPKAQPPQTMPKKFAAFVDDDEWTDFVSSPSVKQPQNGLNTISLNVHSNLNIQKSNPKFNVKNQLPLDIPSLNYITPKTSNQKTYNDRHFQNL